MNTNTLEPLINRAATASERSSAGAVTLTEETQGISTPAPETPALHCNGNRGHSLAILDIWPQHNQNVVM